VFRLRRVLLAALGFASFSACERRAASPPPDVPRDDFGSAIGQAAPAQRIVSLNPTTTEILFAIGAGRRLVGRSEYDTFPDSAKLVPSLGPALRPNVEAILAARPDLVLLYASDDNRPVADRLRGIGIRVLAFKIDSIATFRTDARLLGRLTGDSARAERVVDTVSATLERVRAATANLARPSVFMPTWEKPIIAIGGGSFMNELVEIAGGHNVYANVHAPSVAVTIEDVVQRNPDFVLTGAADAAHMRSSPTWSAIPAVRAGHVLPFDFDVVSRPSVQLGAAAVMIARLLHPGVVR
jgi:ABC-type Fe3+-hydroxamate transport system substrate-binding protein